MSSTQRSEQHNRFFKQHVSLQSGLRKFVSQFENAFKSKIEEEKSIHYQCIDKPFKLIGSIPVEEVFHKLYTNNIFKLVQEEVYGLIHTNGVQVSKSGTCNTYTVCGTVVNPDWRKGRKKTYEVKIDEARGDFSCSCKLFEFKGILCRHVARCIQVEDIKYISEKYILDRWRKHMVRGYEHIQVGYYDPGESARVKKSMDITIQNEYIARLAQVDEEAYGVYQNGVKQLCKQLEEYVGVDTINNLGIGGNCLKVWGRKRLQRRENNQRHLIRNGASQVDG